VLLFLLLAAVCSCSVAMATVYYVAPNGSPLGDGSIGNPWDLPTANANLQAGDTAIMRGGDYADGGGIAPARSGTGGSPIVYQAFVGETPRIYKTKKGTPTGVNLESRSYIMIDGITAQNCSYWIRALQSTGITIKNCHFTDSPNWESSRLRNMGDYLYIGNCSFTNGTDNVTVEGGNYHLIENNTFDTASHTLLVFMGVKNSVIRGNYFRNPIQKCEEVFSTRDTQWPPPARTSEYLVIEDNEYALASGPQHDWAGIQYSGNNSIVRRNVFHDCGVAIDVTTYPDDQQEAWYNEHNRYYHNTFYKNGYLLDGVALYFGRDPTLWCGDQVFVNNMLFLNESERSGTSPSDQVVFGWNTAPTDGTFYYNDLFYTQTGQDLFGALSPQANWTLAEFEAAYPATAANNMEANPQMVDPNNGNFTLQPGSPCIDAGGPLTRTTSAGSGTVIPVADALYFSDGKGIVDPDVIRVGGVQRTIASVNYANNQITVSESLSWANNAPVTLDYFGSGPDIGASESNYAPQPPVADFSGNPTSGPAPLTVYFTDLSTGSPTSWSWTFGDGGTSQAQNPSHQYQTVGSFTVSLTATNAQGSDTETKTNYITTFQAQDYFCNSLTVNTGTLQSGDHTSVHTSNDVYLVVAAAKVSGKYAEQVTYTFNTGLSGLAYLRFTVEGRVSAGSQPQTVYLYNYSTSTWDSKSTSTLGTTDSTVQVEVASPGSYISGGTVQVRVKTGGTGNTAYSHSTDLVKITAAP
jgi:PKD repeat protein